MVTYEDDDARVLDASADLLLQGHIFFPGTVEEDDEAAIIKGVVCSEELYKLLNGRGKKEGKGADDD